MRIRIEAERKAGQLLAEMDRQRPNDGRPKVSDDPTLSKAKLNDLGVSRQQSSDWQRIARVPDAVFDAHVQEVVADAARKPIRFLNRFPCQRQRSQSLETPERSNRQIGSALGVDHKTVAAQRSELESTGEIPQSTERQGADGRVINTANIGRTPASSPVSSAEDDYVPEPEYGYDEPIADSEGVT